MCYTISKGKMSFDVIKEAAEPLQPSTACALA